jgi:pimeloyl-ACP methyl ester carboxylesterase
VGSSHASPRSATPAGRVRNTVLVHGAFEDGSGWRGICVGLTAGGDAAGLVENAPTSFRDDRAAPDRALHRLDGAAILAGHSYGGSAVTEAGSHPEITSWAYVAAFAPGIGQSTLDQYAEISPLTCLPRERQDGFTVLDGDRVRAGFAADARKSDAAFLQDSQVPIAMAAPKAGRGNAARQARPGWHTFATGNGAIAPGLRRSTARRIGTTRTAAPGSHALILSQPGAEVIDQATGGAVAAR